MAVRGEVIGLCAGCLALLTKLEVCGPYGRNFVQLPPGVESLKWFVLCETEEEANELLLALNDGPSASKRFLGDEDEQNALNRRMEREMIQRNRREDRRAAMLDSE
jgi:hypothetical protein